MCSGFTVADVLARDLRTTQGPFSGPTSGWGSPAAGHLTGVHGGRRTGPGPPVRCGGPFSGPTPGPSDLQGSAWPTYWPGTSWQIMGVQVWAGNCVPGVWLSPRGRRTGPGRLTKHGGPVLVQTDVWSGTCVLGVWVGPRAPVRWAGTLTKRGSPSPGQTP